MAVLYCTVWLNFEVTMDKLDEYMPIIIALAVCVLIGYVLESYFPSPAKNYPEEMYYRR